MYPKNKPILSFSMGDAYMTKKFLTVMMAFLLAIPSFSCGGKATFFTRSPYNEDQQFGAFDSLDDALTLSRGNRVTLTGDFSWESTIKDFCEVVNSGII